MRDLSLHIMDILQNSITAKAKRIRVGIYASHLNGDLKIAITDNGIGMDVELLKRVTDPFTTSRSTRKIGLGIPLLKESAERADGRLTLHSTLGQGTYLEATFKLKHIDRLPLGDVPQTFVSVIAAVPENDFELDLESEKGKFEFRSHEIKEKLGEVPITQYEVLDWIGKYIEEGIKTTFGGVLDEVIS